MAEHQILISVVIPTYNYGHLVCRALDSVTSQWREDCELIVVDDGSLDDTAQVLAAYAAKNSQAQIVLQKNTGPSGARNTGIQKAQGRFILLLDADDELVPGALDSLAQCAVGHPDAGMILGAQISVYPDGRERLRLPTSVPSETPLQLARLYLLEKRIAISHCSSLFRRDLLLQSPYPDSLRTGEDIPVFVYLLTNAPVVVTNTPIARIYKHADSHRHNRENEEQNALLMVEEVFKRLPADCQLLRKRYQAQRYLSLFRAALQDHDPDTARRFYAKALQLSPLQAARWTYLRKALRLLIRGQ